MSDVTSDAIATLEQANSLLDRVDSLESAANVVDYAAALVEFTRRAHLGLAAENTARAIRFKAERRVADYADKAQADGTLRGPGKRPRDIIAADDNKLSLEDVGLTADELYKARQVRDAATDDDIDVLAEQATGDGHSLTRPVVTKAHVSNNSGQNEWYTPLNIIDTARVVLGHITLDPATSITAQDTVRAEHFYTAEADGLVQPWFGNVWMNPPYSQPLIGQFIDKVCAPGIDAAIVLVNNATETGWGQTLLARADAVCFPKSRIKFLDAQGNPGAPLQGQMIAYIGPNPDTFREHFNVFGVTL